MLKGAGFSFGQKAYIMMSPNLLIAHCSSKHTQRQVDIFNPGVLPRTNRTLLDLT